MVLSCVRELVISVGLVGVLFGGVLGCFGWVGFDD